MKQKKIAAMLLVSALVFTTACGTKAGQKEDTAQVTTQEDAQVSDEAEEDVQEESKTGTSGEAADEADSTDETTQEQGSTADTAEVPGDYPYDYTQKMDVTKVDFDALAQYDNKDVPYGYSLTDRDAQNRPSGVGYYDSLYGKIGGITHIDTDEKTVYLTMDEGYENGCTPKILDTLKEKNVKAVFFITKQFYDEHPELIERMIKEGHIVGNHTCAHPAGGMPQLGAQAEYEDIKWLNDAVYDKFGYQMRLFRYPEGMSSVQSVNLLHMMGYKSVFWSFAYRDFDLNNQMDKTEALNQCLDQIHPGAVYLLHAVSTTNTAILGDFIDGAREKGFEFGTFPVTVE